MKASNQPAKFVTPFASGDSTRTEIPVTSADPARFSQVLGSPPLTGMPPEAGGEPPQLPDFNGAMNQISRGVWWALGGGRFGFDGVWAADPLVGGYARGAVLPAELGAGSLGLGEWYNNADDNTANPDGPGTGWVPGYHYGDTRLTVSNGTTTLTPGQAAKRDIRIAGTLTGNVVIVVPDWIYGWSFYNNTTGAFTVSVRTASSSAVVIPQDGQPCDVRGDGTNLTRYTSTVPAASATVAGIQRNATNAEAAAGTLSTATVTPASLAFALPTLVPPASASTAGRTRYATDVQAAAATATDLALTPANLAQTKQVSWITGLQLALDGKASLAGANFTGSVAVSTAVNSGTGFTARNQSNGANAVSGYYFSNDIDGSFSAYIVKNSSAGTDGGGASAWRFFNGQNTPITFTIAGVGERLRMDSAGSTFTGPVIAPGGVDLGSSRKLKHIDGPLTAMREAVDALEVVRGTYRTDYVDDGRERAFIVAESVLPVLPFAADAEGVEYNGERVPSLHIEQLVPVLVGAAQELSAELRAVRAELDELRGGA